MSNQQLLFVYNADSGLFNTLADIGHKLFSPQTYSCNLCALSHGYFSEREQWKSFIKTLPLSVAFLHRDEFREQYPDVHDPLPAAFLIEDGQIRPCLDSSEINECADLDVLQEKIRTSCLRQSP